MMQNELWDKILAFDFDAPMSQYSFSIRLANENYWTKNFTQQAILEYKKFMYLAATSDLMVAPSEIIDIVWHQHLIFTQSYNEFCNLIGKQIQHIPSTHQHQDFKKFQLAKERTQRTYQQVFGKQPRFFWEHQSMFDSLHLTKAKLKIRTSIIIGILTLLITVIPLYFLLKPLYLKIGNPDFLIGTVILMILSMTCLEIVNKSRLSIMVSHFGKDSFVYNFHPLELIYLKTNKLSEVINAVLNQMIETKKLVITPNGIIEKAGNVAAVSFEESQVFDTLYAKGQSEYTKLVSYLLAQPVFYNTENTILAFKKRVVKSKKFGQLFYINFSVLSILFALGFVRLLLGISREKPVVQIGVALLIFLAVSIYFLYRLTNLIASDSIPSLYKTNTPTMMDDAEGWQWQYFLLGHAALSQSFSPFVARASASSDSSSSSSCSSNGSSCGGSSCSSCGGCGGD